MSAADAQAGSILIRGSPDAGGWYAQKTPWFVLRRYRGPMLVRALRLDGSSPVRFAKVYGEHLAELRFRQGENNGIQRCFRFLASATLFKEPGCYAFQADGTTFSNVIVMGVVSKASG